RRLDFLKGEPLPIAGGYAPHVRIDCSTGGRRGAVFDGLGRVDVWGFGLRKLIHAICPTGSERRACGIAPGGGTLVAVARGGYRVWNVEDGHEARWIPSKEPLFDAYYGKLAFCPATHPIVAYLTGYRVTMLDASEGKVLWSQNHGIGMNGAFAPDGAT